MDRGTALRPRSISTLHHLRHRRHPRGTVHLSPILRLPRGQAPTVPTGAYGFLLPERPIRRLQVGAEGLVLLDGAARAYAPGVHVEGKLLRRIPVITGFRRPDGAVDSRPALLYRGRVASIR